MHVYVHMCIFIYISYVTGKPIDSRWKSYKPTVEDPAFAKSQIPTECIGILECTDISLMWKSKIRQNTPWMSSFWIPITHFIAIRLECTSPICPFFEILKIFVRLGIPTSFVEFEGFCGFAIPECFLGLQHFSRESIGSWICIREHMKSKIGIRIHTGGREVCVFVFTWDMGWLRSVGSIEW